MRHDDPGLQPERTALSWTRTILSALVVVALSLRLMPSYGSAVVPGVLVVGMLSVTAISTHRGRYHRYVAGIAEDRLHPPLAQVLFFGAAILLLGVLSLLLVLTHQV